MKCKVTLFKAGTIVEEVAIDVDYNDAQRIALPRNPGATVQTATAVFD